MSVSTDLVDVTKAERYDFPLTCIHPYMQVLDSTYVHMYVPTRHYTYKTRFDAFAALTTHQLFLQMT